MSEKPEDEELVVGQITITRTLSDGDDAISYALSNGLSIIEVLGMLKLAELQIVDALYALSYDSDDDEDDHGDH